MAKKKSYDETSIVRSLSKKSSINVNTVNKTVEVVKNSTDVGNGSWGKIDYLRKVHDYVILFVNGINNKSKAKKMLEDDDININSKTAKREAKFNMAAMAKSAMKKAKTK